MKKSAIYRPTVKYAIKFENFCCLPGYLRPSSAKEIARPKVIKRYKKCQQSNSPIFKSELFWLNSHAKNSFIIYLSVFPGRSARYLSVFYHIRPALSFKVFLKKKQPLHQCRPFKSRRQNKKTDTKRCLSFYGNS